MAKTPLFVVGGGDADGGGGGNKFGASDTR